MAFCSTVLLLLQFSKMYITVLQSRIMPKSIRHLKTFEKLSALPSFLPRPSNNPGIVKQQRRWSRGVLLNRQHIFTTLLTLCFQFEGSFQTPSNWPGPAVRFDLKGSSFIDIHYTTCTTMRTANLQIFLTTCMNILSIIQIRIQCRYYVFIYQRMIFTLTKNILTIFNKSFTILKSKESFH